MNWELSDKISLHSISGFSKLKHRATNDQELIGFELRYDNIDSKVFYQSCSSTRHCSTTPSIWSPAAPISTRTAPRRSTTSSTAAARATIPPRGHAAQRGWRALHPQHQRRLPKSRIPMACSAARPGTSSTASTSPAACAGVGPQGLHAESLSAAPHPLSGAGFPGGPGHDHCRARRKNQPFHAARLPGHARLSLHRRHHGLWHDLQGL